MTATMNIRLTDAELEDRHQRGRYQMDRYYQAEGYINAKSEQLTPDQMLMAEMHARIVTLQEQIEALADGIADLHANAITGRDIHEGVGKRSVSIRVGDNLEDASYTDYTWQVHLEHSIRALLRDYSDGSEPAETMPDAPDEEATPLGSWAPPVETGTEHWRIEELAKRLYVASQERVALTPETSVNKLEALACFWAAANFVNVSAALAHSYGDDGLPVGEDFNAFVENFLGRERAAELDAELEAQGY